MKNFTNRECRFVQALTFVDKQGDMKTFTDDSEHGEISEKVDMNNHPDAWSELWKIYIPDSYDKTLSQIVGKNDQKFQVNRKKTSVFSQLSNWLETSSEINFKK